MDQQQIKELFKDIKNEIIEKIEKKLDSKFDEAIDRINLKTTRNEEAILEINSEVSDIKEKMIDLEAKVNTNTDTTVDNTERLDKTDKEYKLTNLRLKEVEASIDEINKKEMSHPRIERLEKELSELECQKENLC